MQQSLYLLPIHILQSNSHKKKLDVVRITWRFTPRMAKLLALLSQTVYPGSSATSASRGVIPPCGGERDASLSSASRTPVPIDGVCAREEHVTLRRPARFPLGAIIYFLYNSVSVQCRELKYDLTFIVDLHPPLRETRISRALNSSRAIRPVVQ